LVLWVAILWFRPRSWMDKTTECKLLANSIPWGTYLRQKTVPFCCKDLIVTTKVIKPSITNTESNVTRDSLICIALLMCILAKNVQSDSDHEEIISIILCGIIENPLVFSKMPYSKGMEVRVMLNEHNAWTLTGSWIKETFPWNKSKDISGVPGKSGMLF
jgi:hypothetical protein